MGFGGAAKQAPFAMMRALNKTNTQGQTAVRAGVASRFIVRNPTFINRLVKIAPEDRATKSQLIARTRIEGPEGSEGRGSILARHEIDAVLTKNGNPAIPTEAYFYTPTDDLRLNPQQVIPRKLYPKALRLQTRRDASGFVAPKGRITRHGAFQLQGKLKTFVINRPNTDTPFGIFQRDGKREGSHHDNIHMIWYFTRRAHLHARLHFGETFTQNYRANFHANVSEAFAQAFKTAR